MWDRLRTWWRYWPANRQVREYDERVELFRYYLRDFVEDAEFPEPIPGFMAFLGKDESIAQTLVERDRVRAKRAAVRAEREAAATTRR